MASRRNRMTKPLAALLVVSAGAYFVSQVLAVQGRGTLAQAPLNADVPVPPAFVMAVDDSGSMNWETLFKAKDGTASFGGNPGAGDPYGFFMIDGTVRTTTNVSETDYLELFPFNGRLLKRKTIPAIPNFGFARSHQFNPGYYSPVEVYPPWANADGTTQAAASPTAALVDPRAPTGVNFNLTALYRVPGTGGVGTNSSRFYFTNNMVIPAGTIYYRDSNSCNFGGALDGWRTVATAVTLTTGDCVASVEYFPATYYLTGTSSPDGNINATPVLQTGGPRTTGGFTTLYRYEIKPANYSSTAAYNAAIQNYANWFQYYRNRNLAIIGSMTHAFTGINFMRVGYFTINVRTPVTMRDMNLAADRTTLYTDFKALQANNSTPNRNAVEWMGQQFRRTDAGAPVQLSCQANAGMLFTDGYSNQPVARPAVGNVDGSMGAPFQDGWANSIADVASQYYLTSLRTDVTQGQVPVPDACSATSPPVSLDCNRNPHMNFYGITLGALGRRFGNAPYIDNPATPQNEATITAFATPPVWLDDIDDNLEAVDAIWHATINTRGQFVNAQSPASVTAAMRRILANTAASASPSGGIALTGSRIGTGSITVVPFYESRNSGTDWYSTLTAQTVTTNPITGQATFTFAWEAASKIPAAASRNDVWFGTTSGALPFTSANVGSLANLCNNPQPGMSLCTATEIAALGVPGPAITLDDAIAYLKGDQTKEVDRTTAGRLRFRTTRLGDIVNATPIVSSPTDNYGYQSMPAPYGGTSYDGFVASKKLNNRTMVYAGSNEGMVHGFDGRTGVLGGIERFAYIPQAVLGHMGNLLFPYDAISAGAQKFQHRYFVDGPLTVSDAYFGGRWQTALAGTTGAGAKSVFALNVSTVSQNVGALSASDRLWEINDRDVSLPLAMRNNMGHVLGRPVIVPIRTGSGSGPVKWRALFGNGYNSVSGKAVLFMVDIATGTPVVTMVEAVEAAAPAGTNGLGNLVAVDRFAPATDGTLTKRARDGFTDTVYAADQKGAVWKFDVRVATPANQTVPLFTTLQYTSGPETGTRQPILGGLTAAPGPGGGVLVYFGTGSFSFTTDPADSTLQSLYAVLDRGTGGTVARSSLLQQTITATTGTVRSTSSNPMVAGKNGFFLNLPTGERFVGYPRIESGVLFMPTYEASTPLGCRAVGSNWLYGLNALNGAAGLSSARLGSPTGTSPGAGTGALNLQTGGSAPVRDVAVLTSPRLPPLGPTATPAEVAAALAAQCAMIVQVAGAPPLYLPRACGRQSWRQIQ